MERYNYPNEIECGSGALTPSRVAPKGLVSMQRDSTPPHNSGKRGLTGKHGNHPTGPRVEHVAITCEMCGNVRMYTPSEVRVRGVIRFCSRACYDASRTSVTPSRASRIPVGKIALKCDECGVEFFRWPSAAKRSAAHYCSKECSAKGQLKFGDLNDPDRTKKYMREYVANNRERHNARSRAWNIQNREQKAAIRRAYRAGGSSQDFTADDWEQMKSAYGGRCLCCGRDDVDLSVDHIVPVAKGGEHHWDNIQPLCMDCNRKKGTKSADYRPKASV